MEVNGFKLPESFVKLCQEIRDGTTEDLWLGTADLDAYENRLILPDIEFLTDPERIQRETDHLARAFKAECYHAHPRDYASPGFVKVTSVHKFVCFGQTGAGEPFCFDFRLDPREPNIVTWNDAYWQRIAPNFETFLSLFAPGTAEEWEAWMKRTH